MRSYQKKAVVKLMCRQLMPAEWRAAWRAPRGACLVTTSLPLRMDRLRAKDLYQV